MGELVPLSASTRDKLAKVLSLTDSEIEAEALAAVMAARRIMTANCLTWSEILAPPLLSPDEDDETDDDADEPVTLSVAEAVDYCLDRSAALTAWERQFLVSLRGFERISERQHETLCRILAKCHAADER